MVQLCYVSAFIRLHSYILLLNMKPGDKNSFNSLTKISVNGKSYNFYSLKEAEKNGLSGISKLPKSLKVLLENLLRFEDDITVNKNQIEAIKDWLKSKSSNTEIAYRPARVLLQDYTGIPAVADLAAMREAVKEKNKDPSTINPLSSVDLVIDHSVQVDKFANKNSLKENVDIEFNRNAERYSFLKWGQQAFNNFRIVPPGTGICHQVNLEYLSKVVWNEKYKDEEYIFPDTLVGTDSHTTMVNGLSVLGWGVGGIGKPNGLNDGYYVKPTVFADVKNEMEIARTEIFGPVLSVIPFETEEEAIKIANDTDYGLTNYIQTQDKEKVQRVARKLRSGMVDVNGAGIAVDAPFGGFKHSGIGREAGKEGLLEFLEVKSVGGWN